MNTGVASDKKEQSLNNKVMNNSYNKPKTEVQFFYLSNMNTFDRSPLNQPSLHACNIHVVNLLMPSIVKIEFWLYTPLLCYRPIEQEINGIFVPSGKLNLKQGLCPLLLYLFMELFPTHDRFMFYPYSSNEPKTPVEFFILSLWVILHLSFSQSAKPACSQHLCRQSFNALYRNRIGSTNMKMASREVESASFRKRKLRPWTGTTSK